MRRMRAVLGGRRRAGSRRVMSHEEASDLLGAYALDAVDGDEFAELEEHLETCPRCRAELDSLREVAGGHGQLGRAAARGAVVPDRRSACPTAGEDEEPPPMPRLAVRGPLAVPAPPAAGPDAPASRHGRHRRRHRRGRRRGGGRARHRTGAGRQQGVQSAGVAGRSPAGRRPRSRTPGHHLVTLDSSTSTAQGGAGRRRALGAGLPGLVDAAGAGRRPDLPAVGDRAESAHLARPARARRRARPPSPWPASTTAVAA